jgi:hypothetical protein
MSSFHYQLIPCEKCAGDLYGPVGVKLEPVVSLEEQIQKIGIAISESHPYHQLNGYPVKRYNDFQFPQY